MRRLIEIKRPAAVSVHQYDWAPSSATTRPVGEFRVRNEPICKLIGRRLRTRRRLLDLTQKDVADRCGLTFQQIQKYEAGRVDMSIARLIVLASILGSPLSEILDGLPGFAERETVFDRRVATSEDRAPAT
jgi:DNA-binding XRE family transcriptional regulator